MPSIEFALTLTYRTNKYDRDSEQKFIQASFDAISNTNLCVREYTKAKRLHWHCFIQCSNTEQRDAYNKFTKFWRSSRGQYKSVVLYTGADISRWYAYCKKDANETDAYEDEIRRFDFDSSYEEQSDESIDIIEAPDFSLLFKD